MARIVDLTLPVVTGMAGIPMIPLYEQYPVKVQAVTVVDGDQRARLVREGVDVIADAPAVGHMDTVLTLNTHIGTHIYATRNCLANGGPVDELPLNRLVMRDAVVLDVSGKPAGAGISGDDLQRTGARPDRGHQDVVDRPCLGQARVLERDDPSRTERERVERRPPEKPFWRMTLAPAERGANHKRWLGAGIPMIQLLTNLGDIGDRFKLVALPLRLRGMDGAPARVVGIED